MARNPGFKLTAPQIKTLRRLFATRADNVDLQIKEVERALQNLRAVDQLRNFADPVPDRTDLRTELAELRKNLADVRDKPSVAHAIARSHALTIVSSIPLELALNDPVRRNGRPVDTGMKHCLSELCRILEQFHPVARNDHIRACLLEIVKWARPEVSAFTIDNALKDWASGKLRPDDVD